MKRQWELIFPLIQRIEIAKLIILEPLSTASSDGAIDITLRIFLHNNCAFQAIKYFSLSTFVQELKCIFAKFDV